MTERDDAPPPVTVRKVEYRCERCGHDGSANRLHVVGDGRRLCASCVRVLTRLATV